MKNYAIILGGGAGTRLKGEIPKQFLLLGERPIIVHTIAAFQQAPSIDAILVVVPAGWKKRCTADLKPYVFDKIQGVIAGGETRQLSCWQALQYLKADPPHICVVHDAARPLVTAEMIEVAVREGHKGMTFGLRARDTIVECRGGEIMRVSPREQMYQVQTPQSFPFQTLWDAHCKALAAGIREASDDAGLVLKAGNRLKVLEGDPRNIKITDPFDLELAQHFLRDR
ncbi:MAG: 2-C-methyl-D-erythritol 4-phosphate cytidylyltransferase [Deltaproteobacteria bacterium RBG_13_52_11]|nr:MAG: 2-C-methyl-D-erythritol 4-phosphate cytidylyltransferase [Deltaproteobacteria bacterium RBG_13_52_11]